jgi:hypothetical protein
VLVGDFNSPAQSIPTGLATICRESWSKTVVIDPLFNDRGADMSSPPYAIYETMEDLDGIEVIDFITVDELDQEIEFEDIDDSP